MGSVPFELPSAPSPWVETPCYRSEALSRAAGCSVFLKLDNLQPSGSFKSRGIGNLMSHAVQSHPPSTPLHFYCSSGGNAGLACITAANTLSRPATIVVPHSTSSVTIAKLRHLGATVHQHGSSWADADAHLRSSLLAHDAAGVYVPPFDHPHIWAGHASIIPELDRQLGPAAYDAIVCSVGGGGLLCGLVQGLDASPRRAGADDVHILGVETRGADSLARSLAARAHLALPGISSIAASLGCVRIAAQTWKVAQRPSVSSLVLSDAEAAMACVRFADEERMLVEISCGVSIAAVYGGHLRRELGGGMGDEQWRAMRVVVEICGGSGVSLGTLEGYREVYGPVVEEMRREEEGWGVETGKGGVLVLGEADGNRGVSAVMARGKVNAREVYEREDENIAA